MDGNNISTDHVIAELINMGFELDQAVEAVGSVGSRLEDAVEFILNNSCNGNTVQDECISGPFNCSTSQTYPLDQPVSSLLPPRRMKQLNITDHLSSSGKPKRRNLGSSSDSSSSGAKRCKFRNQDEHKASNASTNIKLAPISESCQQDSHAHAHHIKLEVPSEEKASNAYTNIKLEPITESSQQDSRAHAHSIKLEVPSQEIGTFRSQEISQCSSTSQEIDLDWERKVHGILQKHFGFSSLKSFQKEAMRAWLAHRDCLVLAATGSGIYFPLMFFMLFQIFLCWTHESMP